MPTPTYTPLATVTLGSSASSVTFSSIPATYRDLVVIYVGRNTSGSETLLRFNADSGSNYLTVNMRGNGSGTGSNAFTETSIVPTAYLGQSATDNTNFLISIMDYSATDKHKTCLVRSDTASIGTQAQAVRWANTAAITSIEFISFGSTHVAGSTFNLYGIAS